MKITTPQGDYDVTFQYDTLDNTHAIVETPDGRSLGGFARCHYRDNFSRSQGRKIALRRALKGEDRSTRRMFWEALWAKGVKR